MKPPLYIWYEGTITKDADVLLLQPGDLRPGVKEKIAKIKKNYEIIIVSALAATPAGRAILIDRLYQDGIEYDDIWLGAVPHGPILANAVTWEDVCKK